MRYKATGPKQDLDSEVCLVQAASALDAAAECAENTNNVEGLLNVSAMWIKFSETLENYTRYKLEEAHLNGTDQPEPKITTGFQASVKTEGEQDASD